jgi:hypothetical protein
MASWTVPPKTPEIREIQYGRELPILLSFGLQRTYIKICIQIGRPRRPTTDIVKI